MEGRAHYDEAIRLYDPAVHRAVATQFGQDVRVATLCFRSVALWVLGYPEIALVDIDHAVREAREIGQAATLMTSLAYAPLVHIQCGYYAAANAETDELAALAEEKRALIWKASASVFHGYLLSMTGKASDAAHMLASGIAALRSTGATLWMPLLVSRLARNHAKIGHFDDAWHCIDEAILAIQTTKERLWEAEVHRMAGEIALMSPKPDAAKAEDYFERALAVARQQQAKSWELRASMSLARLWRDQNKVQQARELLAQVYGWFTEGFDTLDLKEAKALLAELA